MQYYQCMFMDCWIIAGLAAHDPVCWHCVDEVIDSGVDEVIDNGVVEVVDNGVVEVADGDADMASKLFAPPIMPMETQLSVAIS